jgi:hypothetical protein
LSLFDLTKDPGETSDLASEHPDIVSRMETIMTESHIPDKFWPLAEHSALRKRKARKPKKGS